MNEKRIKILRSIDFKNKSLKNIELVCKKHKLSIDELSGLRSLGKMTLGQYTAMYSKGHPWFDVIKDDILS